MNDDRVTAVQTARLVSYDPDPKRTSEQIGLLMQLQERNAPEKVAQFMASSIAAVAYVMLESNTELKVQELFASIVIEARKQRAANKARYEAGSKGQIVQ